MSTPMTVTEDGDPGHRHFSSMHWLYPGTFLPSDENMSGNEERSLQIFFSFVDYALQDNEIK